jgi:hypothetical protein
MYRQPILATACALVAIFFGQPASAQAPADEHPSVELIMARADQAMRPALDTLESLDYEMHMQADAMLQFIFIKGTATRTVRYRQGRYYYERNLIQTNLPIPAKFADEEWMISGTKGWHRAGSDLVEEYRKARVDSLLDRRKGKGALWPMEKAAERDSIFRLDRWQYVDEDTLAGRTCYRLQLLPKKVVKDSLTLAYEGEMEGEMTMGTLSDSLSKDSMRTLFYIDKEDFRMRGVVLDIHHLKTGGPGASPFAGMFENPLKSGFQVRMVVQSFFDAPIAWMPKRVRMDIIAPGAEYISGYISVEMRHYRPNGEVSKDLFVKPGWADNLTEPGSDGGGYAFPFVR